MLAATGVNPGKEAARWRSVIAEAAQVTGYTFVNRGRIDGQAPLQRAYSDDGGFREVENSAYDAAGGLDIVITNVLGNGGGVYTLPVMKGNRIAGIGGAASGAGSDVLVNGVGGVSQMVAGRIMINATVVKSTLKRKKTTGQVRALYLHELGHTLGLGHVNDKRQAMYPTMAGAQRYGAGDRNGLRKLSTAMCFRSAPPPAADDDSFGRDGLPAQPRSGKPGVLHRPTRQP